MKTISMKPKIPKPTVAMPKMPTKPNVGMRVPRLVGMISPLRFNR